MPSVSASPLGKSATTDERNVGVIINSDTAPSASSLPSNSGPSTSSIPANLSPTRKSIIHLSQPSPSPYIIGTPGTSPIKPSTPRRPSPPFKTPAPPTPVNNLVPRKMGVNSKPRSSNQESLSSSLSSVGSLGRSAGIDQGRALGEELPRVLSSSLSSVGSRGLENDTAQGNGLSAENGVGNGNIVIDDDVDMDRAEAAVDGGIDSEDTKDDERDEGDNIGLEGPVETGEEGSEDEDDEDDEEDDEDSDDAGSEDLGGSDNEIEFTGQNASGRPKSGDFSVKIEPGTDGISSSTLPPDLSDPANATEGVNNLIPKKPPRKRRAPDADNMPPPPPPMKTIRLTVDLQGLKEGVTLMYNVLDNAKEMGMIAEWPVDPVEVNGTAEAEADEGMMDMEDGSPGLEGDIPNGMPKAPPPLGLGLDAEDAEEIARKLDERYEAEQKPAKKRKVVELYDTTDDFIDDSELLIDAPTHFGRPKKEGYFVASGPLEMRTPSPVPVSKARPRKSNAAAPHQSRIAAASQARITLPQKTVERKGLIPILSSLGVGTEKSPLMVDSDDEEGPGISKSPVKTKHVSPEPISLDPVEIDKTFVKNVSEEPRLRPPYPDFPEEVRRGLMNIHYLAKKADWSSKGKFPEALKGPLKLAGTAAMRHQMFGQREEGKAFYASLMGVLPFNLFTLTKLSMKTSGAEYLDWLEACEKTGLEELEGHIKVEENAWVKTYEDATMQHDSQISDITNSTPNGTPQLPSSSATIVPSGSRADEDPEPDQQPTSTKAPVKKAIFSTQMRETFGQLMENLQEMAAFVERLEEMGADVSKFEQEVVSGNGSGKLVKREKADLAIRVLRPKLYSKIVALFPEGYGNTAQLSKEMTNWKRRMGLVEGAKEKEKEKE